VSNHGHLPHDWFPRPVPANVRIGEGSWLYSSFAFLHCCSNRPIALRTGRSCGIYNGCFFELGPTGEVELGDYCTLVGVIVATNGRVIIGDYCFFAHEVVIADASAAAPWPRSGAEAAPELSVTLGNDVWVGAGAVLLKGARIGDGAIVAARAVVDFEVPPQAIVAGNPARIVRYARSGAESGT